MSFNKRGPDRRPDRPDRDRSDRPHGRPAGGDWQPRDRAAGDRPYQPRGGDRPYQPRGGDRPYQPRGGDRPYQPRGGDRPQQPGGGDRPFTPRPRFDGPPDEGAMSIRLDPRRVNALKHLAGEAGVRPGDLVRQWVEERIDGSRVGAEAAAPGPSVMSRLEELSARIAALESAAGGDATKPADAPPTKEPEAEAEAATEPAPNVVSAAPSVERVALHDEMIAILSERGAMTAAELAGAITERGRYAPPRSGKPLDAATVSQRVSNPTYRSRFVRNQGRISLAE